MFALPVITLVQSQETLFQVTLLVPNTSQARMSWAKIIADNLNAVGIKADRVETDFDTVLDRAVQPSDASIVGKSYGEGGFDIAFIGNAWGVDPDPYVAADSSQFPPAGQNWWLWNNSESDRLCRLIQSTPDTTQRLQYVKDWQKVCYDEQPSCCILYTQEQVAFDPTVLEGAPFQTYHYPAWSRAKNWVLNPNTTETSIIFALPSNVPDMGLNPLLSTSYYDYTVFDNVFDTLAERQDMINFKMIPSLATSWDVASDQMTWTVHLRQGVTWQDGVPFTADDVKFTFDMFMNDDLAAPTGSFIKGILGGPDNVQIIDANTVVFKLPKVYSYFVENILGGGNYIVPKHVLENVPPSQWKTHAFSTASGSYTVGSYTAYGPIGTGPYVYSGLDPKTYSSQLTKYDNYWNKAALEANGTYKIQKLYFQFIDGTDAALAALKSGAVDVLDSQYYLGSKLADLQDPWGEYVSYDAFGTQEMGFNMQHPILGTGVDTPLGKLDPSRAAEAARYVRQAISHLIPRQTIIDTLMDGRASPGVTSPVTRVTAGFDTTLEPYSYDVTLAKSLLAAAGYDTGVAPPAADILGQYGLYIVAAVVVVVVVVAGVVVWRMRAKKPATTTEPAK